MIWITLCLQIYSFRLQLSLFLKSQTWLANWCFICIYFRPFVIFKLHVTCWWQPLNSIRTEYSVSFIYFSIYVFQIPVKCEYVNKNSVTFSKCHFISFACVFRVSITFAFEWQTSKMEYDDFCQPLQYITEDIIIKANLISDWIFDTTIWKQILLIKYLPWQ